MSKSFIIKFLLGLSLTIVFFFFIPKFFKDEKKDIDKVIRYLDKYLSDMQDIGLFMGVIKK